MSGEPDYVIMLVSGLRWHPAGLGERGGDEMGEMYFDGETYEHDRDGKRLGEQYLRCWRLMRDGLWRTLADIATVTGDPEASCSARLRDMRKVRFGSHCVGRRYCGDGLFEYQLTVAEPPPPAEPVQLEFPL